MRIQSILTKQRIGVFLIVVWVLFSAGYILRDQWLRFSNERIKTAYQQGFADSIHQVMAQSGKCDPITVYEGEIQLMLIEISCLTADSGTKSNDRVPTK